MKRTILLFVGLAGALSLLWAGVLSAIDVRNGDAPSVMSNETLNGTLYIAGNTIRIDGTVKGDVFCAGKQVDINGTVEGDVLCAAQDVTVSGHVEGNVRSAGQTVTVTGKVDGSATLAGMTTKVSSAAVIGRDLTIASQDATLDGTIGRDAAVVSKTFSAAGSMGRDLNVIAPDVRLDDKAVVSGDFTYTSATDARLASGVHIAGETNHKQPPADTGRGTITLAAYAASASLAFISFVILGLVLLGASPRLLHSTSSAMLNSPVGVLGIGLVGLVVPPMAALLLFVTIIGIPLAFIVLFAWIITLIAALALSGHAFGKIITRKLHVMEAWPNVAAIVLGTLVLFIVALIPYVGGYVILLSLLWGIGGLWYAANSQRRSPIVAKAKREKA